MKIEKLSPAFKDYLWGGTKLRDVYGKKCDYEKVAESWELSTHPAGQSVIDGGEYDGLKFGEYLEKVGAKALGVNGAKFKEFPVLIKFIDAKQPLSVQVHPSDEYALRVEGEYGKTETFFDTSCKLFKGLPEKSVTWMSHGDYMEVVPEGFSLVAHSDACPNVAICDETRGFYGVQYHPEVNHTEFGTAMIRNFLYEVCGATGDWTMGDYKNTAIAAVREKVGSGRVLLALSGGVDSSVVAALLAEAVGPQLTCVFVDHGLMRLNEGDEVEAAFKKWDINFVRVNAEGRFLSKLAGISDPERKRKIIGEEFIRVFEEEAKKIGKVDFLAQGTIYPDVVESGLGGESTVIKSHHNVGGLPDTVDFKELVEPLRNLFKDEVRQVGRELGLPEYLVSRQPFPGPGLGIRIIGEVTPEKVAIVQDADAIWREEIAKAGLDKEINQYYAALTNMRSVGVMGDERTYDYAVALRAVTTTDFMTAESYNMPWDVLGTVTSRIVNEVKHVNRVFYDCTGKPPATIELE